ncbi:hypothetical protein CB1_001726004 [Camelus ferus]|nr:hypothetical protein CB1_001726004 [Camelus ferus]
MTAGKQGASPCLTSHERPNLKKPKCRRVKSPGAGQLGRSVTEEESSRNGGPGPPKPPPAPGPECWNKRRPWTPEAVRTRPDHDRALQPGPGSSQESSTHRVTSGRPAGSGPCSKTTHVPNRRKGRPALLGELWRAGDLGAPGTEGSTLSLSDRVERNRLLLQEMLSVGGQGPPKVGIPAWTSSWDRAVPERPAGDIDWDSGISLQDSDQSRTFGPKLEPRLSPRHEEAKHLLQRARMKARTRPLRASHDVVPTLARGSRHPLRALSTNNCNNSAPQGLPEPWGGASPAEGKGACSQEPAASMEDCRDDDVATHRFSQPQEQQQVLGKLGAGGLWAATGFNTSLEVD